MAQLIPFGKPNGVQQQNVPIQVQRPQQLQRTAPVQVTQAPQFQGLQVSGARPTQEVASTNPIDNIVNFFTSLRNNPNPNAGWKPGDKPLMPDSVKAQLNNAVNTTSLSSIYGQTAKALIDGGVNTLLGVGDIGARAIAGIQGDKGKIQAADEQAKQHFAGSFPGQMYQPLDVIGTTLGSALATNNLAKTGQFSPEQLTQFANDQTSRVGITTDQSPLQNNFNILAASAGILGDLSAPAFGKTAREVSKAGVALKDSIPTAEKIASQHPEVQQLLETATQRQQQKQALISRGLSPTNPAVTQIDKSIKMIGAQYTAVYKRELGVAQKQLQRGSIQVPGSKPSDFVQPPKGVKIPSAAKQYIREMTNAQKEARKASGLTLPQKVKTEFKTKLIDNLSPIEDTLNKNLEQNGIKLPSSLHITPQLDRALRTDSIAGQYVKDNGLDKIIQNVPDTKAFDQYLIAKHAADLTKNGIETGRNASKDKALVEQLASVYEPHAQAIKTYNNALLDKAVEYGLVSKESALAAKTKYGNYVPANRIFGEDEVNTYKGTGGGKASVGSQTALQKIKGSKREIESPLSSILAKTKDVISQGERNKAAQLLTSYKDLPGNPFNLTPLRTAEKVTTRQEVRKYLSESKPLRDELTKMVSGHKKAVADITRDIKRLNEAGKSKISADKEKIRNYMIAQTNGGKNAGSGKKLVVLPSNPEELLNQYINSGKTGFRGIIDRLATKSEDVANLKSDLDTITSALNRLKSERSQAFLEGRNASDISGANKNTISVFRDGIKEVYETTPEIAAAAKSLNKEQIGILGKILRFPTRILRLGATGANPAFALANLAKDQASSLINTAHPTSGLNAGVQAKAFASAFNHGSKSYAELVREGAGGTSFNIARDEPLQTVARVRSQKNVATKALYTVTHPGELLRAVEDTIGRSEEFTRAQQYFGNKEIALRKGMSQTDASIYGANAARNNTVNFARAGDYGAVLNSVLPYLNAGVQGSRTLLRSFRERPAQTAAKIAILGTLPTATVTAWNLSDPERKKAYEGISEYEKQGNLIIVPPNPVLDTKTGRWNVIKIPVSQEIANLNNITRNILETIGGQNSTSIGSILGDLIGTATSLNAQDPRQLLGQFTPQALKPGLETVMNQNLFTGNPIVPDFQKNLPAGQQYNQYTSGTAKVVGKLTNSSPEAIDNAIRTSTGGAGQNLLNLSDSALAATGAIQPSEVKGQDIVTSILNRFNSASAKSPSTLASNSFAQAREQLLSSQEYKALSQTDQAKALNRLETDIKAIQYNQTDTANPSGGYTAKPLTKNQAAYAGGTKSVSSYATPTTAKSTTPKTPAEKYTAAVDNYNKAKAAGTLSPAKDYATQQSLSKQAVTSQYPQAVLDFYNLSKAQQNSYFASDRGTATKLYDQAKQLDGELVAKGIATTKYKVPITGSTAKKTSTKTTITKIPKLPSLKVKKAPSSKSLTVKAYKAPKIKKFNIAKMPTQPKVKGLA